MTIYSLSFPISQSFLLWTWTVIVKEKKKRSKTRSLVWTRCSVFLWWGQPILTPCPAYERSSLPWWSFFVKILLRWEPKRRKRAMEPWNPGQVPWNKGVTICFHFRVWLGHLKSAFYVPDLFGRMTLILWAILFAQADAVITWCSW